MNNTMKDLTSIFKLLLFVFGFTIFFVTLRLTYIYVLHIPKDIEKYTYANNTLFFKLHNSDVDYELSLPKEASFSPNDKLSIVFLTGVKPPPKDLKANAMYIQYGVKPIEINQDKEINLFVNDRLRYDLKDKLVLKMIYKDPPTGDTVKSVFD